MIRKITKMDIDEVIKIWLLTNISAHDFIKREYWENNQEYVKEALKNSEVYVYDLDDEILGFIGLEDNYIQGIFVRKDKQSMGIGKELLNYAKNIKKKLELKVYKKNERAVKFYINEGFNIVHDNIDENNEIEYIMKY